MNWPIPFCTLEKKKIKIPLFQAPLGSRVKAESNEYDAWQSYSRFIAEM